MNFRGGKRTKKKRSKSYKKAGNKYRKNKTRTYKSKTNLFTRSMQQKFSLAKQISMAKFMKNYSRNFRQR